MERYTAFVYRDNKMPQLIADAAQLVALTSARIRLIQTEMNFKIRDTKMVQF